MPTPPSQPGDDSRPSDILPAPHNILAFERAREAQVRARQRWARRQKKAARRQGAQRHSATTIAAPPGGGPSPTQRQGAYFEDLAARHLTQAGLLCLAQNLRCRFGEIDIVALDGDVVVFVEVRARRSSAYGGAVASISVRKQARLRRTAAWILPRLCQLPAIRARMPWAAPPACRFDVVAFETGRLLWLTHAFAY